MILLISKTEIISVNEGTVLN